MASTGLLMERENILRYPRLDTVLMVEEFIKKHDGEFKKKKIMGIIAQENDVPNILCCN